MGNSRRWPFVTYVAPSTIKYAAEASGIFIRIATKYGLDYPEPYIYSLLIKK